MKKMGSIKYLGGVRGGEREPRTLLRFLPRIKGRGWWEQPRRRGRASIEVAQRWWHPE